MTDATFKICIFGDGGVGKSSLIHRYVNGLFQPDYKITVGVDFQIKRMEIEGKKITLQIWDFAGEDRFRFILPTYIQGSAGGIFVYDTTIYKTFADMQDWLEVVHRGYKGKQKLPLLLVGSKIDLIEQRVVYKDDAQEAVKEHNFEGILECSSKTGENVEDIFSIMTKIVMKKKGML